MHVPLLLLELFRSHTQGRMIGIPIMVLQTTAAKSIVLHLTTIVKSIDKSFS